jgi:hypothetical protein
LKSFRINIKKKIISRLPYYQFAKVENNLIT